MNVTSHSINSDITENGANKITDQSECISRQPAANGTLPPHSTEVEGHQSSIQPTTDWSVAADEAPPPLCDRSEDGDISDDSLMASSTTNDFAQLLPASAVRKHRDVTPPPRSSTCSLPRHQHQQQRLSSTRSHVPLKTDAAHIKEVAGDDCCVHCLLACLFCELLSMCSAVGECLACGVGGAGCCDAAFGCCCCCVEAACSEEACQALVDCGMLENCCGSADCLEICLECCSICFPT